MYTLIIDFENEADLEVVIDTMRDMVEEGDLEEAFDVRRLTEAEAEIIASELFATNRI